MSEGMKVIRETTEQRGDERGAAVDLSSGAAQVPNGPGTESRVIDGQEAVPVSKELYAQLAEEVGAYDLAAKARGQKHEPGFVRRGYEQLNKPMSLGKALAIVAVTATTVWIAKKGYDLLAKRFGWGIYKNETPSMSQSQNPSSEQMLDNGIPPRTKRQPPASIALA